MTIPPQHRSRTTAERTFDWKPNPDPRRAEYPVRALGETSTRSYRYHRVGGPVLDQGREGACVGHGIVNAIVTAPVRVRVPAPQAMAFGMYFGSRYIDEWPGEAYNGTSVQAGCKLAQGLGLIGSYWWATTVDDVALAVLEHGPVVIGLEWRQGMYDTDERGRVDISGGKVGGHCLLVTGYSRNLGLFRWRNSWGTGYGVNGDAWITEADFHEVWTPRGEAAVLSPVTT